MTANVLLILAAIAFLLAAMGVTLSPKPQLLPLGLLLVTLAVLATRFGMP